MPLPINDRRIRGKVGLLSAPGLVGKGDVSFISVDFEEYSRAVPTISFTNNRALISRYL